MLQQFAGWLVLVLKNFNLDADICGCSGPSCILPRCSLSSCRATWAAPNQRPASAPTSAAEPSSLSASPRVKVWGGGRDSLGEMNLTLAIKFAAGFAVMGMHNWNWWSFLCLLRKAWNKLFSVFGQFVVEPWGTSNWRANVHFPVIR